MNDVLTAQERAHLLRAWPWPQEAATTAEGFEDVVRAVEAIVLGRDELVRAEASAELLGWLEYAQGKRAAPPQAPHGHTNGHTDDRGWPDWETM